MALSIPLMSQGIPFMQLGADLLRSKSMDRDSYNAGDWFNAVDLTKENNNWNIGLPNAEKNQEKWSEIMPISANADAQAMPQDIAYAGDVFQEFLAIRSASPLFRLTTEQDVIDRVGFHNVGKNQQHGLIVMSIDDGEELTDLDPALDALVVIINATEQTLSHTIATAAGFELHDVLKNSVDASMASANFAEGDNEGTFTVPPYTLAVFAKNQGESQGTGLSANATVGAPDVVPYGSNAVFVRGTLNDWGTRDAFEYIGEGEYRIAIALSAGDYEFKIASEDWSTVDFGALSDADKDVVENQSEPLTRSGANMIFNAAIDATYVFSLDASNPENPTLTLFNEEPFVGTAIYVRGTLNDWGVTDELSYQGKGIYTFTKTLSAASYEFKIASEDWSTVDYGSGEGDASVMIGTAEQLSVAGANMTLDIAEQGEYQFVFDASDLNNVTLKVLNAEMFAQTPVFIRGSLNGWGTDNPLMYEGNAVYSTSIELEAGDYEFKVASEDWSTVDYGGAGDAPVATIGELTSLEAIGANIALNITEQGTYTFKVIGPDRENVSILINKQ
jgi:pullulanase